MKFLLDENLLPTLATVIGSIHPGSAHVQDCGFGAADDVEIWA